MNMFLFDLEPNHKLIYSYIHHVLGGVTIFRLLGLRLGFGLGKGLGLGL
jgi:hypothetical protein